MLSSYLKVGSYREHFDGIVETYIIGSVDIVVVVFTLCIVLTLNSTVLRSAFLAGLDLLRPIIFGSVKDYAK